jgi:hypothetical protein
MKKIYFFLKNIIYLVLPSSIVSIISYFGKFRHYKISYSQFGEDLILEKYLENKKIVKGKYLDIGACHPRWLSNTHLLHKKGFTGFCVDLDEQKLKWFKWARGTNVETICGAVSNSTKEFKEIYTVKTKSPFSQIDTASEKQALLQEDRKKVKFIKRKIKNYHINDIFKKVGKINVLNIDIEGEDFDCLKSSNLQIIDPEIVMIEEFGSYFPSDELSNFFSKRNYYLISICGKTKCFAKK